MRKIYSLLVIAILSLCSFFASAGTVTLIVEGDPSNLTVTAGSEQITVVEGENTFEANIPDGEYYCKVSITTSDETDYLTLINNAYGYTYGTGSAVSFSVYDNAVSYTLTIQKIEQDCTANITVDDASKVRLVSGNSYNQIALEDGENVITYSSISDKYLIISPTGSAPLYSVTQNGEACTPRYSQYYIYPSESKVDDVVITANYPDIKVPVTFTFLNGEEEGDAGVITSITVDDEALDLSAIADGYEVQLGSYIRVKTNSDYKIDSFQVNENTQYTYAGYSYGAYVTEALDFVIDAHKYGNITFSIDIDDAAGIELVQGYYGDPLELVDGHNEVTLSESTTYLTFEPADGYMINSIVDENGNDYIDAWSISFYEGMTLTISVSTISRDLTLTVNVHDLDKAGEDFMFCRDAYNTRNEVELVEGENAVAFYKGDVPFGVIGLDGEANSLYLDGAPVSISSWGGYAYITSVSDGSVLDIFFDKTQDGSKTVTIELGEGVETYWTYIYAGNIDNYLSNWYSSLTINVQAGCKLILEPSSWYFPNPSIKVNGEAVDTEEIDGVTYYTFVVTDDCTLSINNGDNESSVNSIAIDNVNNNVYNLQGISVLRNANSEQVSTLPAGLYIINGKKVVKK